MTSLRLDRRSFVAGLAVTGGALWTGCAATGPGKPWFEISLAEWSLHRTLRAGTIDNLAFPKAARGFGIGAVEYVNTFFKDKADDAGYLKELASRCAGEGVRSVLIMCDGEGALGDPDGGKRDQAVRNHHRWVRAAAALGCHSIRVNAQSSGSPEEQARLAADGLRALTEYGAEHRIHVIVENHGGLSSNGAWLASVLAAVGHPGCGALPDFGNFRVSANEEYDRYRGVDELMPFARGVSAKSHDFDGAGDETHTDYRRMLDIVVNKHGWRGYIGVEYEGSGLDENAGIVATRVLLERVRAELAARA